MADVIVIGAGMSGALAARRLGEVGHRVTLVDKGFAPGGRLAARTIGDATFDVGAQFLTAKSARFSRLVEGWAQEGILRTWFHGSPDLEAPADPDGHPRFRGSPTMRRLVEHLTEGADLQLGTVAEAVTAARGRWTVTVHDRRPGEHSRPERRSPAEHRQLTADALVLTSPVPQLRDLLDAGEVHLSSTATDRLAAATYEPCLTVLARPAGATTLPARGAVRIPDGEVAWITDHQVSGASPVPALTVHASAELSRELADQDDATVAETVLGAARPIIGTAAEALHVHRWRYATPTARLGDEVLIEHVEGAPLTVAGDAWAGGRVEGAALSGLAAADALLEVLQAPQRA